MLLVGTIITRLLGSARCLETTARDDCRRRENPAGHKTRRETSGPWSLYPKSCLVYHHGQPVWQSFGLFLVLIDEFAFSLLAF